MFAGYGNQQCLESILVQSFNFQQNYKEVLRLYLITGWMKLVIFKITVGIRSLWFMIFIFQREAKLFICKRNQPILLNCLRLLLNHGLGDLCVGTFFCLLLWCGRTSGSYNAKSLKLAHLIVNGPLGKIHEIKVILRSLKFGNLAITEIHLGYQTLNMDMNIPAYKITRRDRKEMGEKVVVP